MPLSLNLHAIKTRLAGLKRRGNFIRNILCLCCKRRSCIGNPQPVQLACLKQRKIGHRACDHSEANRSLIIGDNRRAEQANRRCAGQPTFSDFMVIYVANIYIGHGIKCDTNRTVECRTASRPISATTCSRHTCQCAHGPVAASKCKPSYRIIEYFWNVEFPIVSQGNTVWPIEKGISPLRIRETGDCTFPRNCSNDPVCSHRTDFSDRIISEVSNV